MTIRQESITAVTSDKQHKVRDEIFEVLSRNNIAFAEGIAALLMTVEASLKHYHDEIPAIESAVGNYVFHIKLDPEAADAMKSERDSGDAMH